MHQVEKVCWLHLLFKGEKSSEDKQQVFIDDYVKEFAVNDSIAITIPILEFRFKNLQELANLLVDKVNQNDNYASISTNGLIITSPRVVEALARAEELILESETSRSILRDLDPTYVFIVGKRSAQEYKSKLGLTCNDTSLATGDGKSLAEYIKTFTSNLSGTFNLLYPKSSLADNSIETILATEHKISLRPIIVYETEATSDIAKDAIEKIQKLQLKNEFSKLMINMVFFSPSGVNAFLAEDREDFLKELHANFENCDIGLKYSSIGKTTEAALLRHKMSVFCVSDEPNPVSLVQCLSKCIDD